MTKAKTGWLLLGILCVVYFLVFRDTGWDKYNAAREKAYQQGQYAEAQTQWMSALKEAGKFGQEDPRLAASLNNLAVLRQAQAKAGGGVSSPQLIRRVEPKYTKEARTARVEGTAILYCVVDTIGQVRNIRVIRPLGMGLDDRAVEAVRQWRCKPGLQKGKPVAVKAAVEVTFRIR